MESTLGKRSNWEARQEEGGRERGRREGAPPGVNKPASSPSSQQRGKLRLRGLSATEREGVAASLSPSVLTPWSCSPQGGAEQVHAMPTDLKAPSPSAAPGQGRKWRWDLGMSSRFLLPTHGIIHHRQNQPPSACLRGLPRSGPRRSPTPPSLPEAGPAPQRSQCHLARLRPPEAAPETKTLVPPSPEDFLASSSLGRSQGTTLASDPPRRLAQEPPPHAGRQSPSLPVSPPRQGGGTSTQLPTAFPGSGRRASRAEHLGTK